MTDLKTIITAVKNEEISPTEGLLKSLKTSTRLGDITPKFTSESLKCGFSSIESYQYLLKNESNLVIMAARPGNGKTALACQIGLNVSEGTKVLLFSLEMRKEALYKRLLSVVSQVPIKKLSNPIHTSAIIDAATALNERNLHVIDKEDLTASQIVQLTLDENQVEKVGLVIIDYVGMISVNQAYRHQEIGAAAKMIKKKICDSLNIPVLMLAQMNRGFEDRYAQYALALEKSKLYPNHSEREVPEIRPNMSDIAESSGIEHCADVAMFLHRPSLLDKAEPPSLFKVYVAKNRNGVVKDFELEFSDSLTKFFDKGLGEDL